MILVANMFGSSIYTVLAIIAIGIQMCPTTNARPGVGAIKRSRNSNTNINTNINTFRKSRRLYEAMARSEAEAPDEKVDDGKEVQTAVIATAAADAAKTVTRAITKRLSETTADAVADAVIRVLTEEDDKRAEKKEQEEAVARAARRTSRFLNEALARLMYRSDSNPTSETSEAPHEDVPPEIVEKMLAGLPGEQKGASDRAQWVDGDGSQFPINSSDAEQGGNVETTRIHRRYLDYSQPGKSHYRRAATNKRDVSSQRENTI